MHTRVNGFHSVTLTMALLLPASAASVYAAESAGELADEGSRRQIEEVVVTAERRESSVQDTAISITAFTDEFIEDFGIRNQEDLQNYIPATTIQPYDLSVRGVGRLYRALGGDPGVATYFDGAYSEDFGIASTEGGLFDLARIEVLRGPQGTLYGRNGIGGAVNFISRRPTSEFEGQARVITGSYNTLEAYGVVSGPIIPGLLNARLNAVNRSRDGFMKEIHDGTDGAGNPVSTGHGEDLNNYGDENYALSLELTPADNFNILVRGNERSYSRIMSGAQGAGSLLVSEMGGVPDPVTGGKRWSSVPMYGWRRTYGPGDQPGAGGKMMCDNAIDRADPMCIVPTGIVPYINNTAQGNSDGSIAFLPEHGIYRFNYNGITRYAQPIVAGVDSRGGTSARNNQAYMYPKGGKHVPGAIETNDAQINKLNSSVIGDGTVLPELDGDDLRAWTSGFNDENFDHQAAYVNIAWDVSDTVTVKYIGAYTDYFYHRTTEDDRTGMPHDLQFYAAQENVNFQHELQLFVDFTPNFNLTAGIFTYENDIDQQLDFYHTDRWSKYSTKDDARMYGAGALVYSAIYGVPGLSTTSMATHRSAQDFYSEGPANWNQNPTPNPAAPGCIGDLEPLGDDHIYAADGIVKVFCQVNSLWQGDYPELTGAVDEGPQSYGTTFIWDTENRTSARAIYFQSEWQMNETWALTFGMRYAEDDKEAEENLFVYAEAAVWGFCPVVAGGPFMLDDATVAVVCGGVASLADYNQKITGAIDKTGNLVNFDTLRTQGIPLAAGIYRTMERSFDDVTWRVNVDFSPTEDDLAYFSITTGYRAGGFNLGFNSPTPSYDKEEIIAYELGYKGQMLDGTLQLNGAAYLYDYDGIALQFREDGGPIFGAGTSVTNGPDVRTIGLEVDVLWLATDTLTIGFNYSFTDATYQGAGAFDVIDTTNPLAPTPVYTEDQLKVSLDGATVPRIPKHKSTAWAEYTVNMGENGTIVYLTSLNWTDAFAAGGSPRPEYPLMVAPAYSRWDARATWTSANGQWDVSAYMNNILDEVGIRNMNWEDQNQNFRYTVEPTNPRMFGLEVQYRFGAF